MHASALHACRSMQAPHLVHDICGGRIHRRGGFIQQQQARAAQQHAAKRQQLLLALRQRRRALAQAQRQHTRRLLIYLLRGRVVCATLEVGARPFPCCRRSHC